MGRGEPGILPTRADVLDATRLAGQRGQGHGGSEDLPAALPMRPVDANHRSRRLLSRFSKSTAKKTLKTRARSCLVFREGSFWRGMLPPDISLFLGELCAFGTSGLPGR